MLSHSILKHCQKCNIPVITQINKEEMRGLFNVKNEGMNLIQGRSADNQFI